MRDRATERSKRDQDARDLESRLATEIRRRLEPVREELRRNLESIKTLDKGFGEERTPETLPVLHPELLDGAWAANASQLTELMADYALTSKLASTYGRIEELRWRLRQRTATIAVMAGSKVAAQLTTALEEVTKPLISELLTEVKDLLERVGSQIDSPDVQPLGLLHRDAATVTLRITPGGHEG